MAWPPTITVQAPHSPTPQPNLGPLMFNTSRSTHSRGISGDTSTVAATLLTVNLVSICSLRQEPKSGPGYYQSSLLIPVQKRGNNREQRRVLHPMVKPSARIPQCNAEFSTLKKFRSKVAAFAEDFHLP